MFKRNWLRHVKHKHSSACKPSTPQHRPPCIWPFGASQLSLVRSGRHRWPEAAHTSVLSARLQAGSSSSTAADRRSTLHGGCKHSSVRRQTNIREAGTLDRRRRLTAAGGRRGPWLQTQAGAGAHLASRCTPRMAAADQARPGSGREGTADSGVQAA